MAAKWPRVNPNWLVWEVGGLYIGRLAGQVDENTPDDHRYPSRASGEYVCDRRVAYELRFRRNFDPRAQRAELFDRTSLR